ncbi:MAG TPA: hypothetical protein VFZ93_02040, partial [Albitalea sp.]
SHAAQRGCRIMSAFVPESKDEATAEPRNAEPRDAKELPSAAERLAASRERMREWMTHGRRHAARERTEAALAAGEKPAWKDRLRTAPVVGIVMDAADAWWTHHPMHPAATLAQGLVRERVAPIARRHPIAIVLGAFVVGVALVRWRPWRLLAKSALFAGLGTTIVTRLVSSVPMESVLEAFDSFTRRRAREPQAAGDAAEPATAAAGGAAPSAPPVPAPTVQAETVTP